MREFILLMHADARHPSVEADGDRWAAYLGALRASGAFDGGSSIGSGLSCRQGQADQGAISPLAGFIRVRAESLEAAKRFLAGNPSYEAGATVEIRELPRD